MEIKLVDVYKDKTNKTNSSCYVRGLGLLKVWVCYLRSIVSLLD